VSEVRPPGSATEAIEQEGALQVLRNKRFLALWLAQVATQVGGNMVLYGLTIQVFSLSSLGFRNTAVSLLILSFLVPAVIFGAIAGVYVDRLDRRQILVWTNALRAFAFIALLYAHQDLALIYLLTIVVSTLTTFFGPAEVAMIPVIVERRQLLPANSLHILTLQGSFFLGFALLGPLFVQLVGPVTMLWVVAALYFLAAGACMILPGYNPRLGAHNPAQGIGVAGSAVATTFSQLTDGLRFILANHTVFWPLTYLGITASLIGVLGVLGPGFATEVLGLTPRDFVVVVLPLGVGLVVGILVLNVYGRYFSRRRGIQGGLVALGLTLGALSIAQPVTATLNLSPVISLLAIVMVVAFAAGIAYAFVAVPAQTQLQEELPPEIRGRVFGVLNMLVSISSFLPIIIVGPIADAVGTSPVVQAAAIFVLVAAAGSIVFARPTYEGPGAPALVDAVDPVAVTSRSLTLPIRLRYVERHGREPSGLSYLSSPVVPGRAGPAAPGNDNEEPSEP
jgi:predicted MFS family arabinose efflux permease